MSDRYLPAASLHGDVDNGTPVGLHPPFTVYQPDASYGQDVFLPLDFHPGPNDVICSRGSTSYHHTANARLRILIEDSLEDYERAPSKKARSKMVSFIIAVVQGRTGRFVKQDSQTGRWYRVSQRASREKVGQAIRAALKKHKQQQQEQAHDQTREKVAPSPSPKRPCTYDNRHLRAPAEEQKLLSSSSETSQSLAISQTTFSRGMHQLREDQPSSDYREFLFDAVPLPTNTQPAAATTNQRTMATSVSNVSTFRECWWMEPSMRHQNTIPLGLRRTFWDGLPSFHAYETTPRMQIQPQQRPKPSLPLREPARIFPPDSVSVPRHHRHDLEMTTQFTTLYQAPLTNDSFLPLGNDSSVPPTLLRHLSDLSTSLPSSIPLSVGDRFRSVMVDVAPHVPTYATTAESGHEEVSSSTRLEQPSADPILGREDTQGLREDQGDSLGCDGETS